MKMLTWFATVTAIVLLLSGTAAMAKVLAYASFDTDTDNPDVDFGWDAEPNDRQPGYTGHPFTEANSILADTNPFYDGPLPGSGAVNRWVQGVAGSGAHGFMGDGSIGAGKFGSGMDLTLASYTGPSAKVPSMLQEVNFSLQDPGSTPPWRPSGSVRGVYDEEGTIEFYFKPGGWDPATDTARRPIISMGTVHWNLEWQDGAFSSNFIHPDTSTNVGHSVVGTLLNDWNHIAFQWDSERNRTMLNGKMVGETVYGSGDEMVAWSDQPTMFMGLIANGTSGAHNHPSDALYDELIFRNVIPEPASLALLGLGGILLLRRRM